MYFFRPAQTSWALFIKASIHLYIPSKCKAQEFHNCCWLVGPLGNNKQGQIKRHMSVEMIKIKDFWWANNNFAEGWENQEDKEADQCMIAYYPRPKCSFWLQV